MSFFANLSAESQQKSCGCHRKRRYRYEEGYENIPFGELSENTIPLVQYQHIDLNAPASSDTLLTGMAQVYDDKITINAFLPIIDGAVFHPLKGGQKVTYKAFTSASSSANAHVASFKYLGDLQKDGDKVYKLTSKFDKASAKVIVITKKDITADNEQILLVGRL